MGAFWHIKAAHIFIVISLLLFSPIAITSSIAQPNIDNLICPNCFGLAKINSKVFTDAPDRAEELLAMVTRSRAVTQSFFGKNLSDPKIILCTTDPCTKIFVKKIGRGYKIGKSSILLSPTGVSQTILTHELVHTEIYARLETQKKPTLTDNRIPTWFDEGLATYLSNDDRFPNKALKKDEALALTLENMKIWRKHVTLKSYFRGYSGAKSLVAYLDKKMGREKLMKIVDRVAFEGADFNQIVMPYLKDK